MRTPNPTVEDIAELVSFLPRLYAPGLSPVTGWGGGRNEEPGVTVLPWPNYASVVDEFVAAASKECWTDHEYTSRGVPGMLDWEAGLAGLGIDDLKSVLTFFVRGERFCDGHWGAMIEAGHMRRVLERLAEIAAESAQPSLTPLVDEEPKFLGWGSSFAEMRDGIPPRDAAPPPWSESLQQQTRDALEDLAFPPDGLLHMKHKTLGYAVISALELLQDRRLVCESSDGRRWEYPDVEALLTDGWAID